ncbi:MAG: rhomboid family intramembrane serine protease [Armatimonadetes bacterium]|nr:rhomboid family intramembrane serine protease [Armatimonadota bacterium]
MFPIRDESESRQTPVVTYTIVALNVLIYLWDRNWNPFGASINFTDLAMVPRDVTSALSGGDPKALVTIFTSLFLHGNLLHLIANLVFLITFGDNVEHAYGPVRYTLYYLFWGIVACVAHVFVMSGSLVPTLGASGAIGGVLGSYLLLFPGHRITIVVYPILIPFEVAAWVMLGFWFCYQIFFPQAGVANWAHVGGFLAGMLTVLIAGGRAQILKGRLFDGDDWIHG